MLIEPKNLNLEATKSEIGCTEVKPDKDPDSVISEAINTEVTSDSPNGVFDGEIETPSDVDFYQFQVGKAEGIRIDLEELGDDSELNSYLRMFDAEGNELIFDYDNISDLETTATDSSISWLPETPGEYFIGISSAGNFDYDQINGNTNPNSSTSTGISTGKYKLELEILEVRADKDSDNTIREAIDSGVSSQDQNSKVINGDIEAGPDVDLYKLAVADGEGIDLTINTQGLNSELNSYLRLFDSKGNELTFDDDNNSNFTEEFSSDSALAFVPDAPGDYYVGVSTTGNFDYDPVKGRTNFSPDVFNPVSTTGSYELGIKVKAVETDSDPDNTIAEAIDSGASLEDPRQSIDGQIDSMSDVDIYRLDLKEGYGVTASVNTFSINSDLDSYLRLFDENGNELLFDNNDESNLEDGLGSDSLLRYAVDTSGAYYIAVSSDGSTDYDSVNGSDNFTPDTGVTSGNYNLRINISEVIPDSDPDNTIAESISTEIPMPGEQTSISGEIDINDDVDLYQLELGAGDTLSFDIDTVDPDNRLDTILQIFDANGVQLALNDDESTSDEESDIDAYLEFTAVAPGEYFVGVSSYGNFDYDPLEGSNNFSNNFGSSRGNYDLLINTLAPMNTIVGTKTANSLDGTEQPDLIKGWGGNDTISGAAQGDIIAGNLGDDSLQGDGGDDFIQGGVGADELSGGPGDDTLEGNQGSDLFYGNEGADTFIISSNGGGDTIADFEPGIDKIVVLSDVSFTDIAITNNASSSSTILSFDNKTLANLNDITPEEITVDDFAS